MNDRCEKMRFSTGLRVLRARRQADESISDSRSLASQCVETPSRVFHRGETGWISPTVVNQYSDSRLRWNTFATGGQGQRLHEQGLENHHDDGRQPSWVLSQRTRSFPPLGIRQEKIYGGKRPLGLHPERPQFLWKKRQKWVRFFHRPGFSTGVFPEPDSGKSVTRSRSCGGSARNPQTPAQPRFSTVLVEKADCAPPVSFGKRHGLIPGDENRIMCEINWMSGNHTLWKTEAMSGARCAARVSRWKTKPFSNTNRRLGKTCYTERQGKSEPRTPQTPLHNQTRGPRS